MTCERPHARTHQRITHIWIDTHTHKHTDSEKERKNLCICLKTLTAAGFYTRTVCVYVIHRNSYIFFGRLFSCIRRKYYPCHHIFQLDVRRLSESMRNRLMERRETFHYISADGLSLLLSLSAGWDHHGHALRPFVNLTSRTQHRTFPHKKSDWHIWPLRNDLIVHCPSIFISIRNGC
jgi:hypothetical protein